MQRMDKVMVRHTYREQNGVVDALVKEAANSSFWGRTIILAVPPMFANNIFFADILGTEVVRNFWACNIDTIEQNMAVLGELQYPSIDSTM
ncbi:hypothetical protein A4A49_55946, partial [Nicotiana attenuata]